MSDDDLFRMILLGYCLVFMPFGLYHRLRANTGEKLDRWQEGVLILFGLRLTSLTLAVGGIGWLINPAWLAWAAMPIPAWIRWIGLAMAGLGGMLLVWTFRNLDKNLTDTVVTRKQHTLVTTGPYRWIRHPFYASYLLGFVGCSVAAANWLFLLLGTIGFGFMLARIRIEEQKLIERFGDAYRRYMARTGRFVPRIVRTG